MHTSVPAPPLIESFPAPPPTQSFPPRALIVSTPELPSTSSAAAVPLKVPEPVPRPVRGVTVATSQGTAFSVIESPLRATVAVAVGDIHRHGVWRVVAARHGPSRARHRVL